MAKVTNKMISKFWKDLSKQGKKNLCEINKVSRCSLKQNKRGIRKILKQVQS